MFNENDRNQPWTYPVQPQPGAAPQPGVAPQPVYQPIPQPAYQPIPQPGMYQPAPQPMPQPVMQAEPQPVMPSEPQVAPQEETPVFAQEAASGAAPAPAPQQSSKKKRRPLPVIVLILIGLGCSLVGGALGSLFTVLLSGNKTVAPSASGGNTVIQEGVRESTVIDINKIDTSKVMTAAEVYATNVNSTVGITTAVTTNIWGFQTTSAAAGSGFILTKDGYILTNHHVIEGSTSITVSFYDGSSAPAELIGYDVNNDIALLKVALTGLTPVVLGDSNNLNVGDDVVAIGNPLGELTFSLTAGAVSALKREVTTSNGITMNLIQTDCAINSGNSGGALFNMYGEVVGITNAKYSSNSSSEASIDNIGFAIPVNSIKKIVTSLIENGYIAKPYIGISVSDVSEETQSYGLPQGAAVKEVAKDSPAAQAGLQVNDIITKANGTDITGRTDLVSIVGECNVGDVLKVTVYRQGTYHELEITVGETIQSATQEQQQQQQTGSDSQQGIFPFENFPFFG